MTKLVSKVHHAREHGKDFRRWHSAGGSKLHSASVLGKQRWVESGYGELFFASLILLNALFLAWEAQMREEGPKEVEYTFLGLFTVEVLLRLESERISYFRVKWNWLDFGCVIADWAGIALKLRIGTDEQGTLLQNVPMFRVLRLLRTFRLVRMFTYVRQLMVLLQGIVGAVRALVWSMVMVVAFIYVCASFWRAWLKDHEMLSDPEMHELFGSLDAAIFTFFQVMTLENWQEVAWTVQKPEHHGPTSAFLALFLIVFVSITNFMLLNLVMGVIVDSVLTFSSGYTAETEPNEILRSNEEREGLVRRLRSLQSHDLDRDGLLSMAELELALERSEFAELLTELGVAQEEAVELHRILNPDGRGVPLDTYLGACQDYFCQHGTVPSKGTLHAELDLYDLDASIQRLSQLCLPHCAAHERPQSQALRPLAWCLYARREVGRPTCYDVPVAHPAGPSTRAHYPRTLDEAVDPPDLPGCPVPPRALPPPPLPPPSAASAAGLDAPKAKELLARLEAAGFFALDFDRVARDLELLRSALGPTGPRSAP